VTNTEFIGAASGGRFPQPDDREEFFAWYQVRMAGMEAETRARENRPYENTMDGETFAARYLTDEAGS
jgi:hypothetical protein